MSKGRVITLPDAASDIVKHHVRVDDVADIIYAREVGGTKIITKTGRALVVSTPYSRVKEMMAGEEVPTAPSAGTEAFEAWRERVRDADEAKSALLEALENDETLEPNGLLDLAIGYRMAAALARDAKRVANETLEAKV
jgi:hypothetical protein